MDGLSYRRKKLSEIAPSNISHYALSGQFIRTPELFAIGDLLMKAIKGEQLIINSDRPVIRSYVNASDVAKCSIRWLMSNDEATSSPIGASTHITTIVDLAK